MGGLRDIVTFVRLILYRCRPTWVTMYAMRDRDHVLSYTRPTRWFARNLKHVPYKFAPDRAKGMDETRSSSQVPIINSHPMHRVLLSTQNEPHFLIARRTAAKHATSAKTKGVSLNLSQRVNFIAFQKKNLLFEVCRKVSKNVWWLFDWSQRVRY